MQLLSESTYCQVHNLDANPVKHIEKSTEEYLHASFLLWEYKQAYSKGEYRCDVKSVRVNRSLRWLPGEFVPQPTEMRGVGAIRT